MTTMIPVQFTNDADMGADEAEFNFVANEKIAEYLNADPRHAVVILNVTRKTAIWRGASDEEDNFYYQDLPLDEPDAEGGGLTATEAIAEAMQ